MIEKLEDHEYIRQRIEPKPGDQFYLVLADLLSAIKILIPDDVTRVLDYGCGGSPYRALFKTSTYHRADLAGGPGLDFEFGDDARLPADLSSYDCILSSQVLEHVPSPLLYLQECYRVLKPEGKLLLSTHGLFEDHDCPGDYWRWTASGLRKLVESVGFRVRDLKKVTTGPRAVVFFLERENRRLEFRGRGLYSRALSYGARLIWGSDVRRRHEVCDASFSKYRVVGADEVGHDMYVCIALTAQR